MVPKWARSSLHKEESLAAQITYQINNKRSPQNEPLNTQSTSIWQSFAAQSLDIKFSTGGLGT